MAKKRRAEAPALFELNPSQAGQPTNEPAPPSAKESEDFVDQVMYSITAPFIGYPGWGDDPQFWEPHKTRVTMERLLHHQEIHRDKVASEYETMIYLSSASLAGPMSHNWAQVYFYLFARCMPEQSKVIGDEVREFDSGQQEDLTRLRRWIFKQQMNHMKAKRAKTQKAIKEVEEESQQLQVEHPRLF